MDNVDRIRIAVFVIAVLAGLLLNVWPAFYNMH